MKNWKPVLTMLFFGVALILGAQQILAKPAPPCYGSYETDWYGKTASSCVASWQGAQVGAYAEAEADCGVRTRCGGIWDYSPFCQYGSGGYFTCVRLINYGCTGLEP